MTDTPIYLGRPGALRELPYPRGGADITRLRTRAVFALGSGGVRMSQLPGGKRRYTYGWQSLDLATYAVLEAFDQGHEGVGPFVLLDPSQVNMLTDNQSAATSVRNDTDNFTVAGSGCTITSDATVYNRGPASLRWDFTVGSPSGALLTLDSPSPEWPGIPIVNLSTDGATLNTNAFFEADASGWSVIGGTIARSITQAHEGVASLLMTPDGVTSACRAQSSQVTASAGSVYRASAWVRCAATRSVDVDVNWFTAVGVFLSGRTLSLPVTANTWTLLDFGLDQPAPVAPANTGRATIQISETGTPSGAHTVHMDEVRLRQFTPGRSLCFWFTALGGGSDPIVTLTPQLQWLDASGEVLSTTSGTPTVTNASTAVTMSVSSFPPANAVWVKPLVAATAGSISAGAAVWLDQFQLEAGTAPTTWRPGTGVLPVQVVSLPEAWPWGWPDYRSGATLVLQEVGR